MKMNVIKMFACVMAAGVCLGGTGQAQAFWTDGGQGGGALEQLGISAEITGEEAVSIPSPGLIGLALQDILIVQENQTPLDSSKQTMQSILGPDWEARLAGIRHVSSRAGYNCKEASMARLAVEESIAKSQRPAELAAQILFAMENFSHQHNLSIWEYRSPEEHGLYFIAEPAQNTPGALEEKRTLGYQCVRIVNAYMRKYLGLPQKEIYSFYVPEFASRVASKPAMPPAEMLRHVVDFRNISDDTMKAVVNEQFRGALMKKDAGERIRQINEIAKQLKEVVVDQFELYYLTFIVD